MSDATTPATHADWEDVDDVSWTLLDREELVDAYRAVVAPAMEADGLDPDQEKPTHSWLHDHDFRPLLYALREYHDVTFGEFWATDLGLEPEEAGYDWATDHERTVEALESFLTSRRERKGLADSSIDTLRYRLNRYVAAYSDENDTDDLVAPVARDGDVPAYKAVDACWAAFDRLHEDLDGGQTKRRIHLAVSNWYAHLVRRKWAAVNPADGLDPPRPAVRLSRAAVLAGPGRDRRRLAGPPARSAPPGRAPLARACPPRFRSTGLLVSAGRDFRCSLPCGPLTAEIDRLTSSLADERVPTAGPPDDAARPPGVEGRPCDRPHLARGETRAPVAIRLWGSTGAALLG